MNNVTLALPKPVASFELSDLEGITAFLNDDSLPLETTFEVSSEKGVALFYKHVNWGLLLSVKDTKDGIDVVVGYDSLYADRVDCDVKFPATITIRDGGYHYHCLEKDIVIDITEIEAASAAGDLTTEAMTMRLIEENPSLVEDEGNMLPLFKALTDELCKDAETSEKYYKAMTSAFEGAN